MAQLMSQLNKGVLVVSFSAAKVLDQSVIEAVGNELKEMVGRAEDGKLLLNFSGVKFLSSSMLGKLIVTYKECQKAKVDLKLSNIAPEILEVFKLTKLDRLLKIYDDEAAAMKAFEKTGWFS